MINDESDDDDDDRPLDGQILYWYPSHGYTVLKADEIFKKYQAILACRGSLGTTYIYM